MNHCCILRINGESYQHYYTQWHLPHDFDLIRWLQSQRDSIKGYWNKEDCEAAFMGSVLTLNTAPHFDKNNESSARFWGGHCFAPDLPFKDSLWSSFPKKCFFLPKIEISKQKGNITATINSIDDPPILPDLWEESLEIHKYVFDLKESFPKQEDWIEKIKKSLEKIKSCEFSKIVYARRTVFSSNQAMNPYILLSFLPSENSVRFAIQFQEKEVLIGTSPEKLFKRKGSKIYTEAVAGTRKRGKTEEEDTILKQELIQNEKEKREINLVVQSISEALIPLCQELQWEENHSVIKTQNVQHLRNRLEGILLPEITDTDLLSALHPTAAIGGFPKEIALSQLLEEETFERGWYASPFGYCSQNTSEFIVAIRSALVKNNNLHLFAGAGIVAGSSPEKEWNELEHKISFWSNL